MGRTAKRGGTARAALAVVALYGLVLQAFLSGMAPNRVFAGQSGLSALCAPGSVGRLNEEPVKPIHCKGEACCPAACCGFGSVLPTLAATRIDWPARVVGRLASLSFGLIRQTGPPPSGHSPRGPPLG